MRLEDLSKELENGAAVARINENGESGICVFLMSPITFIIEESDKTPFPVGTKIIQPALLYCIPDHNHMKVIHPFIPMELEEVEATDWQIVNISFSEFTAVSNELR